jgi:hypothetical protein
MDSGVLTAVVVCASGRPFGETGDNMAWTAKVAEAGEGAMGRKSPSVVTGSATADGEAMWQGVALRMALVHASVAA